MVSQPTLGGTGFPGISPCRFDRVTVCYICTVWPFPLTSYRALIILRLKIEFFFSIRAFSDYKSSVLNNRSCVATLPYKFGVLGDVGKNSRSMKNHECIFEFR